MDGMILIQAFPSALAARPAAQDRGVNMTKIRGSLQPVSRRPPQRLEASHWPASRGRASPHQIARPTSMSP
jgi:hypothetical protein